MSKIICLKIHLNLKRWVVLESSLSQLSKNVHNFLLSQLSAEIFSAKEQAYYKTAHIHIITIFDAEYLRT